MGNIVWLCSYPKSGNTWFRLFLSHLLYSAGEQNPFYLDPIPTATSRSFLEQYSDLELSDLTNQEVQDLRPLLYDEVSSTAGQTVFVKTHDACVRLKSGKLLISERATQGVIYIVRNPLDIATSYAFHLNKTTDEAIAKMNEEAFYSAADHKLDPQITYFMGSWSHHVHSWTSKDLGVPVFILKYEDMLKDPLKWFTKALTFAGISKKAIEILAAIESTDFKKLTAAEDKIPFFEKHVEAPRFFRKGKAGAWKEELTSHQVNQLLSDHGEMMNQMGYSNK